MFDAIYFQGNLVLQAKRFGLTPFCYLLDYSVQMKGEEQALSAGIQEIIARKN